MTVSTKQIKADEVKIGYSVMISGTEHGDEEFKVVDDIGVETRHTVDMIHFWFEDGTSIDRFANKEVTVLLSDVDF